MNTHETYVSLETAKLLKQTGFDWECDKIYYCYHEDNDTWDLESNNKNHFRILELDYCLLAPSLAVAQKWLREAKEITVNATDYCQEGSALYSKWRWYYHSKNGKFMDAVWDFHSYEQALEAGIQKCLSELLKEQHPKKDEIIVDVDGYEGLPPVLNLGDGTYQGRMAGHSFLYNGREYYSTIGIRCPVHVPTTIKIENGVEDIIHNN